MSTHVHAALSLLRRTITWSNSQQAWVERAGAVSLLLAAIGIITVRNRLSVSQELLCWSLFGIATAILLRHGWFKLSGPLLFFELMRVAHRPRYFVIRSLFPIPLAFLVCWIFFWSIDTRAGMLSPNEMAGLSASVFYTFICVQFILVFLLTPAYTAGAVTEEKEHQTLEFLFATDLRNREIVLSKLAARLANLTLLVLTGLPVLSLVQFLGGVDPNLLLASFAATAVSMASLAGYGIFNSVLSRIARRYRCDLSWCCWLPHPFKRELSLARADSGVVHVSLDFELGKSHYA